MCNNSGQSCNAPTRMLVPAARMDEAAAIAAAAAAQIVVGDPTPRRSRIGPVVSAVQYDRIQQLIEKGIGEGATLEVGGPGKPDGLETGYYVKPTVFSHVTNDMTIAREEIFGPVLVMIGYEDDDDAVRIANDTPTACPATSPVTPTAPVPMARRIRTGNVHLNGAARRHQRSVRWLQAVRKRPRVGALGHGGVPRDQGHPRLWQLTAFASAAASARLPVVADLWLGPERGQTVPVPEELACPTILSSARSRAASRSPFTSNLAPVARR